MFTHEPVLLAECLRILNPESGESVLDVTLGLGGHARAFIDRIGPTGRFIGLDADSDNLRLAQESLKDIPVASTFIHANFLSLPDCLPEDRRTFDVIIADIGLSSVHVDDPSRGFTFRKDAPLDLRFDRTTGMTGAALLASLDPSTLLSAFREYGELPRARSLVDAIVRVRGDHPILRTGELVDVVRGVFGYKTPDVLPQIFQALRILVNQELSALRHLLAIGPSLLKPGGRLGIISFHSLEDRLVKHAFRGLVTETKDVVTGAPIAKTPFTLLTPKAVRPSAQEVKRNSRSRSACLRALSLSPLYTSRRT
ncbi:MAG: 16S rRNA (cytosine(1402)-N(4))-methyltransferase RsmH [Candidatus Peribacteraceae bacterium]|nr:16S rRNA (cytosine(1402)-N(4))-methyltransferase RsmH [Candidatus Peribacteraceae bacterium]